MPVVRYTVVAGRLLSARYEGEHYRFVTDGSGNLLARVDPAGTVCRSSAVRRTALRLPGLAVRGLRHPVTTPTLRQGEADRTARHPSDPGPWEPPVPTHALPRPSVASDAGRQARSTTRLERAAALTAHLLPWTRQELSRAGARDETVSEAPGRLFLWVWDALEEVGEDGRPADIWRSVRRAAQRVGWAERQQARREVSLDMAFPFPSDEWSPVPARVAAPNLAAMGDPDPTARTALEQLRLAELLGRLTPAQQVVLRQRLAGVGWVEIGILLGRSGPVAWRLWQRAQKHLREP